MKRKNTTTKKLAPKFKIGDSVTFAEAPSATVTHTISSVRQSVIQTKDCLNLEVCYTLEGSDLLYEEGELASPPNRVVAVVYHGRGASLARRLSSTPGDHVFFDLEKESVNRVLTFIEEGADIVVILGSTPMEMALAIAKRVPPEKLYVIPRGSLQAVPA